MAVPTGFKIGATLVEQNIEFTLDERTMPGGDVGSLNIIDADNPAEDSFTYTLVTSDEDATAKADDVYEIVRDPETGLSKIVVKAGVTLDYETLAHQSRDLWIQASDGTDSVVYKVTMKANGINEAPSDVTLSQSTIAEDSATDTEIGLLSAIDQDLNDTFTFALKDNAEGRFKLDGNKLVVADGSLLNFEAASSHQIKIEVTDFGGLTFEKTLTINVGDGVDTFTGTNGNNKIIGTAGVDLIDGGYGNDVLYGLSGDDLIDGGAGNDFIHGSYGNDLLQGGAGNDKIYGSLGNDTINGGLGKDLLSGGTGKDTFVFNTAIKRGYFDQITDFNSADDTLQFSLAALQPYKIKAFKKGKLSKGFFTVGDEPKDGNDYIYYNKKNGFVYLDVDGDGGKKGIQILKVKPGTNITADDFLFI